MKFRKAILWILLPLALIILGAYLWINYDSRRFLCYGALHIQQQPGTVKIIDYNTSGWMDQQYEYYVTLDKHDLPELLSGRKYHSISKAKEYIDRWATDVHRHNFIADTCYTSGDLSNGLVNVFVNKENTAAYVVYDIQ